MAGSKTDRQGNQSVPAGKVFTPESGRHAGMAHAFAFFRGPDDM